MNNKTLLTAVCMGLAIASAKATTINYVQQPGTPYQTTALSTFETTGSDMSGMSVWVTYSDGSSQHSIWATTGAGTGAASVGGYFSISETGTTFNNNAWTLQNLNSVLSITSFTLMGAPGSTVFDRTFANTIGTSGSAYGKDFAMAGNYAVTATYSDILNLTGAVAVGDEFVQLGVTFGPNSVFGPKASTTFTQDTDNAATKGDITSVPDVTSTGMLFGLGFMAVAALKRRIG